MKNHFFWVGLIWLAMIVLLVGCGPTLPSESVNKTTTITECDCPTCPPCNCPTAGETDCPEPVKCEVCETCMNNTALINQVNDFAERYNNCTGENLSLSMLYP